ncbi:MULTISPECIES: hypothetical protein [Rhizobium]|uniref:hypothetical protein n=1 Tax=Rhizobium TaxID=379 RepID=UPI000BE7A6EF|nr:MULTISPECIES: hypothetical protein [Rhizobium]MBY4587887.1 hypothetical protein [Rhizobium redzepovicii]MBY4615886.1 hypothetical protein [Rhizobium redzepovicii]MDF0659273.1 hypothetical protein [Rhizobium sp. BC49]PDS83101.1 hypothetical protein CO654_21435 [Rhizobium sp. L18]TBY45468.1 hypothetical protein E0H54_20675 [Rhizobium leguminosarum bv. viciae]
MAALALLEEREKRFGAYPRPDWPSLDSDPAEAAAIFARGFAKFVLRLRSADALERAALRDAVDAMIADNDRMKLIEVRLGCIEYGMRAYQHILEMRQIFPAMRQAIEERALRIGEPGKRKFFRKRSAESIRSQEDMIAIDEAFISFLQKELQPSIDAKIREQSKTMADDEKAIRDDLNQRFPKITARLAK